MTAWLERKACRPEHADLFFGDERAMAAALALCRSCDAVAECRADAIAHGDIVDGHTTQGQVVGGCAPPAAKSRAKGTPKRCELPTCREWFVKIGRAHV